MSDVLDQSDIDALLASATSSDLTEPAEPQVQVFRRAGLGPVAGPLEIKGYDFKRPERVSKDQMRALQTLHDAFARNFGASLSGYLRSIVEIKVATCEQMTYSEFIGCLPNPTSFNLVKADGLEGQMCLEISPLIIYPIIDRLLGGTSSDLFIPQRAMTLIEMRLISNVIKRGLQALSEAWSGVRKLEFSVAATESNPQLVQIVPPNEVAVVISFELKTANRAGTMNLCIPFNVIEPVISELSSQSWFSTTKNLRSKETQAKLENSLGGAPMTVTGLLGETTISVKDLMTMSVGDVIAMEKNATSPIVVCVGGEKKYLGNIGQHRGQRALKILRMIEPTDRV